MSRKVIKPASLCKRLGHSWVKVPALGVDYCRRCGKARGNK